MDQTGRYSIEELAELGGVSRRTVRYYVQEQLLPAPLGVGRGRHYGPEHLARLRRLRELQEMGLSLAEVRARLWQDDVGKGPERMLRAVLDRPAAFPPIEHDRQTLAPVARTGSAPRAWTRVEIGPGVELHVADGVAPLTVEALEALEQWHHEFVRRDDPGA